MRRCRRRMTRATASIRFALGGTEPGFVHRPPHVGGLEPFQNLGDVQWSRRLTRIQGEEFGFEFS